MHRQRLLVSLVGGLLAVLPAPAGAQDAPPVEDLSPRDIAARARPAVVLVTGMLEGRQLRQGSGFVVRADGFVVTNHHVIQGADDLRVQLSSGEELAGAYVVKDDADLDLALLRLRSADLPALPLGADDEIEIGDPVFAMGNPLGLEGTFSNGLLSARREIDGSEMIQISAPVSPGSSGGPVLNARGEVIGVVTLSMRGGQNLNLAVPARYIRSMLEEADETPALERDVAGSEGLQPWAVNLQGALQKQVDRHAELVLEPLLDPVAERLDNRSSTRIDIDLDVGTAVVLAVCDTGCIDIDLTIYDPRNEVLTSNREPDAQPFVGFEVQAAGRYGVRVHMQACAPEPCGVLVQAYDAEVVAGAVPSGPRVASSGIVRTPRTPKPFVPPPEMIDELQAGFEEVAPGSWDRFVQSVGGIGTEAIMRRSGRAVVEYTTDEEFLQILRWRVDSYRKVADDPVARTACSVSYTAAAPDYSGFDLTLIARLSGRALARDLLGRPPWRPPVPIVENEALWTAYLNYLLEHGYDSVVQGFAQLFENGGMDDRSGCLWQADFYEVVLDAPNRRLGSVTMLQFVRGVELAGQGQAY